MESISPCPSPPSQFSSTKATNFALVTNYTFPIQEWTWIFPTLQVDSLLLKAEKVTIILLLVSYLSLQNFLGYLWIHTYLNTFSALKWNHTTYKRYSILLFSCHFEIISSQLTYMTSFHNVRAGFYSTLWMCHKCIWTFPFYPLNFLLWNSIKLTEKLQELYVRTSLFT